MFQSHKASYYQMDNFIWVYASENGHDIGWQLIKASDANDCNKHLASVVGSEDAYQVIAGDLIMDGIYDNLPAAKKAAEKYILQFIG